MPLTRPNHPGLNHLRQNPHLLPVGSLIIAATLWGLFWYPLRLFEDAGLHGLWTTLLMYVGTLPMALYLLRGRLQEFATAPGLLLLLAITSGWCNTSFILAMLDGNVLRVLLLFYLAPLWTVVMGYLFLGEKPDNKAILVVNVAMIGALVMLWDPSIGMPLPRDQADWLALSSGFTFAITNVCVRKLQQVSIPVKTVSAWLGSIVIAATLIGVLGTGLAVSGTPVYLALIYGALVMVVMTMAVQYGVTNMPVYRSAVILLFELVVGAVSSWLLTHEQITIYEWIGGGLVVGAAYLSASREVHEEEASA